MKLKNNDETFIRKQTAVWLFHETEKVYSDRLLRVRAKQPNARSDPILKEQYKNEPFKSNFIKIGEFCAFEQIDHQAFRIGKVTQFIELSKGPYKGNYADVWKNCGVICTWYSRKDEGEVFEIVSSLDVTYHHIKKYICTIPQSCITNAEKNTNTLEVKHLSMKIGKTLELKDQNIHKMKTLLQEKSQQQVQLTEKSINGTTEDKKDRSKNTWVKCGNITLSQKDKTILSSSKKLTDIHVNAAQQLLKLQFKDINELQLTLYQKKHSLKTAKNVIQILHADNDHWAVITTRDTQEHNHVKYYDSSFSTISNSTESVILDLLKPQSRQQYKLQVNKRRNSIVLYVM